MSVPNSDVLLGGTDMTVDPGTHSAVVAKYSGKLSTSFIGFVPPGGKAVPSNDSCLPYYGNWKASRVPIRPGTR